jgi:hypothetical protein
MLCVLMGPEKSGKTTLLAQLGVACHLFPFDEDESLVDSLQHYAKDQTQRNIFTKCTVELDSKVQRKVSLHDLKKQAVGFAYRKSRIEVVIFVISLQQAVTDSKGHRLAELLNLMRVNILSKIVVVVSHTDEKTALSRDYEDVCRKYTEVYQSYSAHWKRLQMKIVPVDSITGWNFLPRNNNNSKEHNIEISEHYEGPSFIESLAKFHAEGFAIDCPWRVYAFGSLAKSTIEAYLTAGELKVGDLLLDSEITCEIEEILVDQTTVKSTFAQPLPITLKLKESTESIPRLYLYGPGIKSTSRLVARMMFLQPVELPLRDVKVRSFGGPASIIRFTVQHILDPITYNPIETSISVILTDEVFVAEIQLDVPIRMELESTYPEQARLFLTTGTSPDNGAILAIGITTGIYFSDNLTE